MSQGRPPAPVFRPPQPQHWQGGHGQQETLEVPGGVLSSESGFEESSVFGLRRPVVHHGAGLEPLNDPGVQMSDKQLGHASNDSTGALAAGRLCRPIRVASVTTRPLSGPGQGRRVESQCLHLGSEAGRGPVSYSSVTAF